MYKVKDFLTEEWMTMELFWETLESMPDDYGHKKHKDNVKALFKKDGTPKAKALAPETDEDYQTLHSTSIFVRKVVRNTMRMNRRKKRRDMILKNIQDVKEHKDIPRRVTKDLQYEDRKDRKNKRRIDRGEKL